MYEWTKHIFGGTFSSSSFFIFLQLLELFDGYVEQENKCEEILTEGIDYYHNQFNQLMTKPTYYGVTKPKTTNILFLIFFFSSISFAATIRSDALTHKLISS